MSTAIAVAVFTGLAVLTTPAAPAAAGTPPFVAAGTLTAAGSSRFGGAVAIDGDTMAVGAPSTDQYRGAVYVFTEGPSGWGDATLTATLTASDVLPGDEVGISVAISGDTIVAGATEDLRSEFGAHPPPGTGAVYVFDKPASGWADATETQELRESHGALADDVGASVAISGDTIVAGAPGMFVPNGADLPDDGGAVVFTRSGTQWSAASVARLVVAGSHPGDEVGLRVAIDGDTIVIGSQFVDAFSGKAFVYTKPSNGWRSTDGPDATLWPTDSGQASGLQEGFAASLAIEGGTVFVGAPGGADNGGGQGRIYIFSEPFAGWSGTLHEDTFLTPNGATGFGEAVSVWNGTLAGLGTDGVYEYAEPQAGWFGAIEEAYQPVANLNGSVAASRAVVAVGVPDDATGHPLPGEVLLAAATDSDLDIDAPSDVTATATASSGAIVDYPVPVAHDTDDATAPPVSCTPRSGSTFPIGSTTVICTAWDLDDATSPATVRFTVVVARSVLTVQAPSVTAEYGSVPADFQPTYSGFVNGDTAPQTPATCSTPANDVSPPGTYPITCTGAVDPNYTITYRPGTLTIVKAATTATVSPQIVLFGASKGTGLRHVSAALIDTATGRPVVGRSVTFTVGNVIICTAATDTAGRSSCIVSASAELQILRKGTITASFAGDADYLGAAASTRWLVFGRPW